MPASKPASDRSETNRVKTERARLHWSQQQLADISGVSRQVIATVETDRHSPSVAVALALASALQVSVEVLFSPSARHTNTPLTTELPEGTALAKATVGNKTVPLPLPRGAGCFDGWGLADGISSGATAQWFDDSLPATYVLAGCDPLLAILSGLAERATVSSLHRIICTHATTARAIESLSNGEAHAAFVHGQTLPKKSLNVARWKVAKWQVGLAALSTRPPQLLKLAERNEPVIQRPNGAGSQASLDRALINIGKPEPLRGPIANSHLDVARCVSTTRRDYGAGLTMEAAAIAYGLAFTPLEEHQVELWIDRRWLDHPVSVALLEVLNSQSLIKRADSLGGYDMSRCGASVP